MGVGNGEGDVQPFWEAPDNLPKSLKKSQISMPFNLSGPLLDSSQENNAKYKDFYKYIMQVLNEDDNTY